MAGSFANNLINNSIYHLLNFEKYTSFQMAAREAAISNNYQLVLLTEDFNTVFSVETRHTTSIEDAVRYWLELNPDRESKSTKLDVDGVVTYWGPISISSVKYYLMLVDNDQNYKQDEIIKLAEIIELAIGMWNYRPERDTAAEFIRALRRGNRGLADTLLDAMDIREQNCEAVVFVPRIDTEKALSLVAAFETSYKVNSLRMTEGNEFACVFTREHDSLPLNAHCFHELAEKFHAEGASKFFYVSNVSGIDGMSNAFQLINETEAFVKILFPQKSCFGEFELALVSNSVNICMNGGTVKKYYTDLLRGFKRTKEGKSRQLQDTLEIFMLDAGLSAIRTAEILDIHVNTVQYRLKRIREILDADISDTAVVPGLMMALAVSRLSKEVKSF